MNTCAHTHKHPMYKRTKDICCVHERCCIYIYSVFFSFSFLFLTHILSGLLLVRHNITYIQSRNAAYCYTMFSKAWTISSTIKIYKHTHTLKTMLTSVQQIATTVVKWIQIRKRIKTKQPKSSQAMFIILINENGFRFSLFGMKFFFLSLFLRFRFTESRTIFVSHWMSLFKVFAQFRIFVWIVCNAYVIVYFQSILFPYERIEYTTHVHKMCYFRYLFI